MIKKRKNAKNRKHLVIHPVDAKTLETIRARLKPFPPLDFSQLLKQAEDGRNGMDPDDSFRAALSLVLQATVHTNYRLRILVPRFRAPAPIDNAVNDLHPREP
jgi:hypothetical protein